MNGYSMQDALMSYIIFVCSEMNFNKCLFICCGMCLVFYILCSLLHFQAMFQLVNGFPLQINSPQKLVEELYLLLVCRSVFFRVAVLVMDMRVSHPSENAHYVQRTQQSSFSLKGVPHCTHQVQHLVRGMFKLQAGSPDQWLLVKVVMSF